ncbi:MAG: hypothetical protein MJ138_00300 [Kiritimatiellae bacterium]|nr:hypothetical protein [Kiritimatiellia bacterium]
MKKLICTALVAGSMFAVADEVAKPATAASAAPAAAETAKVSPKRSQMSPEARERMLQQREKFMAARRAKMESQMLEVVKKYVADETKANELVKELAETMMAPRRMMPRRERHAVPTPVAKPTPPAEKPAESK